MNKMYCVCKYLIWNRLQWFFYQYYSVQKKFIQVLYLTAFDLKMLQNL